MKSRCAHLHSRCQFIDAKRQGVIQLQPIDDFGDPVTLAIAGCDVVVCSPNHFAGDGSESLVGSRVREQGSTPAHRAVLIGLSPLTLLTLTLSGDTGQPAADLISKLSAELAVLQRDGGLTGVKNTVNDARDTYIPATKRRPQAAEITAVPCSCTPSWPSGTDRPRMPLQDAAQHNFQP